MPVYLDTRGKSRLMIAVCARCGVKYPWSDLSPDPNSPGLMCCPDGCRDEFDPWRLPARESEDITAEWCRPDASLAPGAMNVAINPLQAVLSSNGITIVGTGGTNADIAIAGPVTIIGVPAPWSAGQAYPLGAQVTAGVEYGSTTAAAMMAVYVCLVPGISGATPPAWPQDIGVEVKDGSVTWLTAGWFLP